MANKQQGVPYIPNIDWMIKAGINPKTGLPIKMDFSDPNKLKENIKKQLRVIDEQDYVNKGIWYNMPVDLSTQEINRMLYYKYNLCFFYNKELDSFFLLPFALSSEDGTGLDVYGRYREVRPIAYVASAEDNEKHKKTPIEEFLSSLHLKVRYTPLTMEEIASKTEEELEELVNNSAVIIQDYTPQYNQMYGIPRYLLQEGVLDAMAECIPLMRTNLMVNSGVLGVRVGDQDQAHNVLDAGNAMIQAALSGKPYLPIEGQMEFQELTGAAGGTKAQDYMLAMQSLDNFRLSAYGIDNGGLFEKKAHELQSEADLNGGPVGLVQQDDIMIKQKACNIINSIWGLGVWYEPSETLSKADMNGDGLMYDRDEGENSGNDLGGNSDDSNV